MADPLSIAMSIITLLQLSKSAIDYVKNLKCGSEERVRIRDTILSTISVLEMLKFRFEDTQNKGIGTSLASRINVQGPMRELERILEKLVARLAPASRRQQAIQLVVWPFDKEEVRELLAGIESKKSFFNLAMQNEHMRLTESLEEDLKEVTFGVEKLQIGHDNNTEQLRTTQERDMIDWISPMRFFAKQSDIEAVRVEGTSGWIIQHPLFQEWLNGARRTLWCPGIPGAGKTIVASVIVNHLLDLQRSGPDSDIGVAFLYCDYKAQQEQTALNLISSILHQFSTQVLELPKVAMDVVEEWYKKKTSIPVKEAMKAMEVIIAGFKTIYVVIDALDECTDSDGRRTELLTNLLKLPPNVKILSTSRDLPDIKQFFLDSGKILVEARNDDVEKYLKQRIQDSKRLRKHVQADPNLLQEIVEKIVHRIDGMFLLASLHLETLSKKQDRKSVRRALETLPTSLEDTYDQALQRIRSQDYEDVVLAEKVLYWISFAFRPLKVLELRCAIAVTNLGPGEEVLCDDALVDEEFLIDVCAGIVTVDSKSSTIGYSNNTIRLVHYSTQEYFERNRATIFPDAQKHITQACLRYLSLPVFAQTCRKYEDFEQRLSQNPLLKYAANYWGEHAAQSPEKEVLGEVMEFIQMDSGFQLQSSVQDSSWDFSDLRDARAIDIGLWLTTKFGLTEAAKFLLSKGADITFHFEGNSVLGIAVLYGREEIIVTLLENSATGNEYLEYGENPLSVAVSEGHPSIARLLLDKGFDVNAQDCVFGSALLAAVETDKLARKQDFNKCGDTALIVATTLRHLNIFRLLVERGADIEAKNNKGENALVVSAKLGNCTMARSLLEMGVSVTEQNWLGWTILHHHIQDENMMELLISYGADVNAAALSSETPLHSAASIGSVSAIAKLIHYGANVNATTLEGFTPMDKAKMHGHNHVVQWLISRHAAASGLQKLSANMSIELLQTENTTPLRIKQQFHLNYHNQTAWGVEFSNNGRLLATSGEGVFIYETENFTHVQTLRDYDSKSTFSLTWSTNDSNILTSDEDYHTMLWDVTTGTLLIKLPLLQGLNRVLWVPGKTQFITASADRRSSLILWSMEGIPLHDFGTSEPLLRCAISPKSGNIVLFAEKSILIYHPETFSLIATKELIEPQFEMISVSTSSSSPYALIHLWDDRLAIMDLETLEIVDIFEAEKEDELVFSASFGGLRNNYIACGSLAGHISIFNWETKKLVSKQMASTRGRCNSIAWNPKIPNMLASATDKGTVTIWKVSERQA